jgi:hypothetical protein
MAALVVLALTGFSTGRGHGSGHGGSGGGGGGCSSSSQDHDSSSATSGSTSSGSSGSHYDDYDDTYDDDTYDDSSSGSSGSSEGDYTTLDDAEVELLTCASEDTPYATIEVTNLGDQDGSFYADVTFEDANGDTVDERGVEVRVAARSVARARVALSDGTRAAEVAHCEADPLAPSVG